MKNFASLMLLACILLFASSGASSVKACDRSSYVLDSIVFSGGLQTIYTTMCIGGGLQGVNKGANGDSRDMGFGFYTPGAVPITISAFTPASITGDTTGCTYTGVNAAANAGNPPFSAQGLIAFVDFFGCPAGYTCIGSQAVCGRLHTQCTQVTFTVDILPDSIRLFGAEGGGNPVAGCYPNPDMVLTFTVLPVVWGDFTGRAHQDGILLNWSTLSETNNDHFEVFRSENGNSFEKIADLSGIGNATQVSNYEYLDRYPMQGISQYKIRQVDIDGGQDETEVISMTYTLPDGLSWNKVGPTPTDGPVSLDFFAGMEEILSLKVFDVKGEVVIQQRVEAKVGSNKIGLDLSGFGSGVYYLRLAATSQNIDYKLMKF